ncbi:metal-binding protein [ANME-1 cluster archaeon ex4572_4]|nr:UPF0058 family protein [Methanophagales archaeon]OYT66302.1 MAG: metal-binding protein [ANME-1 cluster archaeon ex4572_4]PXF51066.1 MAG: metal-binding protein [Methanophagales archaeon]
MKKEEVVHLHLLLAQLKKYCEENGGNGEFVKYNKLGITPFQVHRSKAEHKQAIFVLGTELVSVTAGNNGNFLVTNKK